MTSTTTTTTTTTPSPPPSILRTNSSFAMNTHNGGANGAGEEQPPKAPLASIAASVGWYFPEVKLASWDPEDEKQWNNDGHKVAHRNLLASMPNLACAFGVWLTWSIITSKIQLMHDKDPTIYPFQDWDSPQGSDYNVLLYTLPAVAGLSGGTLRVANSFMTQIIGGRNVVYHSSIMLTFAMILTAWCLNRRDTPFNLLLVAAWLSGTGGGAFASSMSNMSFLYPKRQQGYCLGMNGGLGNLGVSISQLLVGVFMGWSFGKEPISDQVDGWPNHAGWFWWPLCTASAGMAYIWMSNHPDHGNHSSYPDESNPNNKKNVDWIWNIIFYYYFEFVSLICAAIVIVVLIVTRDQYIFTNTALGQIGHKFMLVIIAMIIQHLALRYLSPKSTMTSLRQQSEMFHDKHTYVMTFLYVMSFGSFIGFSGAFPKLITDLFGYVTADGCYYEPDSGMNISTGTGSNDDDDPIFIPGGTEFDCIANTGVWGSETITNPNAPDVFAYAWLGALVGSVIRPVGGILADRHGGAKLTQILIIWCTVATICLGILVQKTGELKQPERNFGLFVFLFLNLFLCTGAMNGTTFRTIGVLFDAQLAGSVLGWSSAVASYGAFIIPAMFGVAISRGHPETTLYCLAFYYTLCGILNYWFYGRPGAERPGV